MAGDEESRSIDAFQSEPANSIIILFGPKTRLAQALLTHEAFPKAQIILISRDAEDSRFLKERFPEAGIVSIDDLPDALPAAGEVTLYCCAAGPIHPRTSGPAECEDAMRDLLALQRIIHHYQACRMKVVLISSVLALVASSSRATYGGWKLFLEGVVSQSVRLCKESSLSVVYPGRLVEKKRLTEPLSVCYTGYRRLASKLLGLARWPVNSRTIIGLDARLWVCAKRALALASALLGGG